MKLVFSTVKYVVGEADTIEKIAARCDCTPSQLMKLNKLNSRLLFTGQTIFVPDGNITEDDNESTTSSVSTDPSSTPRLSVSTSTSAVTLPTVSPAPEIVPVPSVASSEIVDDRAAELDADCVQKFVKFSTVQVTKTDGACPGVLIITPNCVMFDPDAGHQLVMDNGQDKYGMVAPIDAVVSVGLYESLPSASAILDESTDADSPTKVFSSPESAGGADAKQRERTRTTSEQFWAEQEPDDFVNLPSVGNPVASSHANNGLVTPEASTVPERRGSASESILRRKLLASALPAFVGQPRRSSVTMGALKSFYKQHHLEDGQRRSVESESNDSKRRSSSPSSKKLTNIIKGKFSSSSSTTSVKNDSLTNTRSGENTGRLIMNDSWYNAEPPSLAPDGGQPGLDKDELQKQKENFEALNILKRKTDELRKNLTYFYYYCLKPSDGSDHKEKLPIELPFVHDLHPANDYFLRIHLDERRRRKEITKNAGLYDFGDKSRNDFLFRVPFEKIDVLYLLFLQWSTEKSDPDARSDSTSGFGSQIDTTGHDTFDHVGFVFVDNTSHYRPESEFPMFGNSLDELRLKFRWEIVAVEEMRRRMSLLEITEASFLSLPDGASRSTILTESMIRRVVSFLPARAQGYPWVLIYSSEEHGFSLATMYRKMAKWRDEMSPTLLIIKDTNHHVFGAIVNCELRVSEHFYGSGESLLFTVDPEFRVYRWTGANNFVAKGSQEGLAIGAGRGTFGLYLDADFFHGRTQPCDTFDNEPLTSSEDFTIAAVEAFGFSVTF